MEAEYYTPDITEFHIGFEYEVNGRGYDHHGNVVDLWSLMVFPSDSFLTAHVQTLFTQMSKYIGEKTVRVKKLDSKDIEAVGWVEDISRGTYWQQYSLYNKLGLRTAYLVHYTQDTFISKADSITIAEPGSVMDNTLYQGLCRNKSHLARLMKDFQFAKK